MREKRLFEAKETLKELNFSPEQIRTVIDHMMNSVDVTTRSETDLLVYRLTMCLLASQHDRQEFLEGLRTTVEIAEQHKLSELVRFVV